MSEYTFKPAVREAVPLLLGVIGQTGSGKTFSAMRIASGIVGKGNRFALIDTESKRALHYADKFDFDHCELKPPFRPDNYADAIREADRAGYKAIVVDSMSHEHAGEGGVLDWHEEELTRMVANALKRNPGGSEYQLRESMKMAAWIKPKMAHKQMVQRLLQVRSHLILCFRAEDKVKMEKDDRGKIQIVPAGIQPICSKEMPYELMASFLLTSDKPGYPQPLKLQEQHKPMFPLDNLLSEESGHLISEWAKGGAIKYTGKTLFADIFKFWQAPTESQEMNRATAYEAINRYAAHVGIKKTLKEAADLDKLTDKECEKIAEVFEAERKAA
jgi:hypothetical protein